MKISENSVEANFKSRTQEAVLAEIVSRLYENRRINDKQQVTEGSDEPATGPYTNK